jgi:hypothetical protein
MYRTTRRLVALLGCVVGIAEGNPAGGAPTSADKVKITVKADKPADGKQVVTLTLEIARGWHLYANPVLLPDLAEVQTAVTFAAGGKPLAAKIEYPVGRLIKNEVVGDYRIYEGVVTIKATVDRRGDGPIEAVVFFQATSDVGCPAPSKVRLKIG